MRGSLVIETPRLRLRPVDEADLDALARINADPEVMRFMGAGKPLDRAETWRQIAAVCGHQELRGYSIMAIEDRASGAFLGRGGVWNPVGWPMVEVGWVVDPRHQRKGIATEAGGGALDWCFANLDVDTVCSVIDPGNAASARVAQKLGGQLEKRVTVMDHKADLWVYRRPSHVPIPTSVPTAGVSQSATRIVETKRIRLRPFAEADLDHLARLYADEDVMRYIGDGATLNRERTWRQIALYLGHAQFRGYSTWVVEDRASGALVGECGPWFPEGWPMLEVGWLIDPRHQGRGLATEAARAVLDWCFAQLDVAEICSLIHPDNAASKRVADKLGATCQRRIAMDGVEHEMWMHRRAERPPD